MAILIPYDRVKAVLYAHVWAYGRNPAFYDFTQIGGDCTNFASQCIYAGSGVMNFQPVFGWYYLGVNNRSPSWTGVEFLYRFLTGNRGPGPFARETGIGAVEPGDVLQLGNGTRFYHTPVIVAVGRPATPRNILVAAHTDDADNRPLSTYNYAEVRFLHILGVRLPEGAAPRGE